MLEAWELMFPDCPPVAYELKTVFRRRWVRFHSLPESKRYPEDEDEYRTVLGRHNCILAELLGADRRVVLLTTGWSGSLDPVRPYAHLEELDPDAKPWQSVLKNKGGEVTGPIYWHVFASEWEWRPGLFDPIIRLVADDVIANLMIVPPDCRWHLHPYDGGMDVILESAAARSQLRASHRAWLSHRSDGL